VSEWTANDEGVIGTSPIILPHLCVKCGQSSHGGTRYEAELDWTPGWIWIGILWGFFPVILLYYASVRRVDVEYSLCTEHRAVLRRRKQAALWIAAGFLVVVAAAIAARVVYLWPVAFVVFLAAVITWSMSRPPLRTAGHEDGVFGIRGFGPDFLSAVAGGHRRSSEYA
jgi:hypothetical protein